jgi:hypothetical protein
MMLEHALEYAAVGWEIFPLRGKIPALGGGHGVLDATNDLDQVGGWWLAMPDANIGGRVPSGVIVVDLDPRHGALDDEREQDLPPTLTCWSGRGDGGRHLYYRHLGPVRSRTLPAGWDLKTHRGYVVLPPSIHPDTGRPYRWEEPLAPVVRPPGWLVKLIRPPAPAVRTSCTRRTRYAGESVADWYSETTSWSDVLVGWVLVHGDGDADGSGWRHPTATAHVSATVRHGLLFVYSTNTLFEPTEPGAPRGYTKFRAFAVLEHGGDLSAAAYAIAALKKASRP